MDIVVTSYRKKLSQHSITRAFVKIALSILQQRTALSPLIHFKERESQIVCVHLHTHALHEGIPKVQELISDSQSNLFAKQQTANNQRQLAGWHPYGGTEGEMVHIVCSKI